MSRLRADKLTNKDGTGAPTFPNGVNVTGVATATGGFAGSFTGDIGGNITGVGATFTNITGSLTGNTAGTHTGAVVGDVTGNLTGNVTGTAATFSGNVSVGGVLTYQDVTSIDSVGMITARKGIQVLADGVNVVGTVTATEFVGGGSGLTGVASPNANTISCVTASNTKCDEANGRLPVFGGGNFQVFYSPGNFNTAGINCVRARVIGAGSYGCTSYWVKANPNGCLAPCICYESAGGAGGGYAHATVSSLPGGNVPVVIGCSWKTGQPTTFGDSKFWDKVCGSGGMWPGLPGCGYADPTVVASVQCSKGGDGKCGHGGAAGTQLGNANDAHDGSVTGAADPGMYAKGFPNRFPFDIFVGQCAQNNACEGKQDNCFFMLVPSPQVPTTGITCDLASMSSMCTYLQQDPIMGTGIAGANKFAIHKGGMTSASCCFCFKFNKGGQGGAGAGGGIGGCDSCFGVPDSCAGGCGGLGGGGGNIMRCLTCYTTQATTCLATGGEGGRGVVIVEW